MRPPSAPEWAATELAGFVARLSVLDEPEAVLSAATEAAAEALGADVAAAVVGGAVVASVGWPSGHVPTPELLEAARATTPVVNVPGSGPTPATAVPIGRHGDRLLLARVDASLSPAEVGLLGAMAQTTRMAHGAARLLDAERRARLAAQKEARENARLLDALVEASEAKDDFLSVVTHELRTPLTSIVGFTRTMRHHRDAIHPRDREYYLSVIERQATRLTRLVDDLLDVSRIESAEFHVETKDVDLATEVRQVVEESFYDEGTAIEVDAAGECPVRVDPDHLRRMVVNLVENSLKYGQPPVQVGVTAEATTVVLQVRDHGDGVPVDFQPEMFDKFAQSNRDGQRLATGVGLGLSIVRGLADANDAEVVYEEASPGARFLVRFTRAPRPEVGQGAVVGVAQASELSAT